MPTVSRRQLLLATPALAMTATRAGGTPFEVLSDNPRQLQAPLEALDCLLTPPERFFVRSHFGHPRLDRARTLTVGGLVSRSSRWTLAALQQLPPHSVTAVLQCAGNGRAFFQPAVPGLQWRHGALGQARWTGVRLATLLGLCGVRPGAAHVHFMGADRPPRPQVPPFVRRLPLEKALHANTLVAWEMNGAPLVLEHGAPLRLVVPGWTGDHWLKWLVGIELSAEAYRGYFVQEAYRIPSTPVLPGTVVPPEQMAPVTALPVTSLITSPLEGATVARGELEIRGIAFSGNAEIATVEVSVDGGRRWGCAALEGEPGEGRWQRFRMSVRAPAGVMTAVARATDSAGKVQPETTSWNPSGYLWNCWHRVTWSVE